MCITLTMLNHLVGPHSCENLSLPQCRSSGDLGCFHGAGAAYGPPSSKTFVALAISLQRTLVHLVSKKRSVCEFGLMGFQWDFYLSQFQLRRVVEVVNLSLKTIRLFNFFVLHLNMGVLELVDCGLFQDFIELKLCSYLGNKFLEHICTY